MAIKKAQQQAVLEEESKKFLEPSEVLALELSERDHKLIEAEVRELQYKINALQLEIKIKQLEGSQLRAQLKTVTNKLNDSVRSRTSLSTTIKKKYGIKEESIGYNEDTYEIVLQE